MDIDTLKQVDMRHGSQEHRRLEEMPSLQTLEGTTISALSRDYHHQGGYQEGQNQDTGIHEPQPHVPTRGDDEQLSSEKHGWMHQDRQDRKCIMLEAAVASMVVIGIVIGAVLGTQLSSHANSTNTSSPTTSSTPSSSSSSSSPSDTAVLTPSLATIPVGTTFNVSITVVENCTASETCASPVSGVYTAGVSTTSRIPPTFRGTSLVYWLIHASISPISIWPNFSSFRTAPVLPLT